MHKMMPMKRRSFISTLCLAQGALWGVAASATEEDDGRPGRPPGYPVSLAQLQEAIAPRFPVRYPVQGLLNLDLLTPRLQVLPEQNRLRAEMPVDAAGPALNRRHQGSFEVDFGLRYEASDRTLRAHQLKLGALRFPSLRPQVVELLNLYAPMLAEESLDEVVLHQLRPQDLRMLDVMGMQPGDITVTRTGLLIGLVPKPLS